MLAQVQERIVTAQAGAFAAERRCCAACGQRLRAKDTGTLRFRTAFGDVRLASPRLRRCACDPSAVRTVSPLEDLFAERVAPEMLYLQTRWASLVSYGVTVDLLRDVLAVAETVNPETVRAQLHRVAERADADLGDEYGSYAEGTLRDWAALPPPEGEIVVGLDGGYVRGRERPGQAGHFEVLVGRSMPEDRDSRYFGFVAHGGTERERHAAQIAAPGRMAWQKAHGYGLRSPVETAISRLKAGGSDRPTARNLAAPRTEVALRI